MRMTALVSMILGVSASVARAHDEHCEIAILQPSDGAILKGERTISVSVLAHEAGTYRVDIYFDMVGLSTQTFTGTSYSRSVTVDTSHFYDGEHLINVHVHALATLDMCAAKRVVTTANGRPAPNGDTKLPAVTVTKQRLGVGDGNNLDTTIRLADDRPVKACRVLPHINGAILRALMVKDDEVLDPAALADDGLAVYRVSMLPFQGDAARERMIHIFVVDGVGRVNMVEQLVSVPAKTAAEKAIALPDAEILNQAQFREGLPSSVKMRLTNPGQAYNIRLWVGDIQVAGAALSGNETEITLPVTKSARLTEFLKLGYGDAFHATAVWVDFRPAADVPIAVGKSGAIPVLEHFHVNPVGMAAAR